MECQITLLECLNRLSEFCLRTKTPYSNKDMVTLKDMIIILSNNESSSNISSWMKLQDGPLPLECLWQLQSYNLLQFTTYIYYNTNLINQLCEKFEEQIWSSDETAREERSAIVAGLMIVLVNLGVHTPRDIYRPGQELLTSVVQKFVDRLLRDPAAPEIPVPFFKQLVHSSTCVPSKLKVFCLLMLRILVQSMPQAITLEEAVQEQAKLYTCHKTSPTIIQIYSEILSNLTVRDVINELSGIIMSQEQFNWRWLLTAVSVFTVSFPTEIESFKGVLEQWFSQACISKNTKLLSIALLFARQCYAENTQKFGSYSTWFGSLQVRRASAFTFLFNFLSQLVPYEPVLCLKIHINKVPSAPANCHSVVMDYITLAKTRLSDLNHTTDYIGLFGEYTTSEQEGRDADIAKVITHFKQTKEVMKIVLEASVFRRQFYERVFLTELLKDGNPEHIEFIEKLYKIGKIPHGMYNRWCQLHL